MLLLRVHPVGNAALQRWFIRTVLAVLVGVLLPLLSVQSSYADLDTTPPDLSFHPYHFVNTPGSGNDTGPINLIFMGDRPETIQHFRHHIPRARARSGTVFQFEDHISLGTKMPN